MEHFDESGVLRFSAGGIEARNAKRDLERLPLPGVIAGVCLRRVTFVTFLALSACRIPSLINRSTIVLVDRFLAKAIEHLNFIAALQVDAAFRAFWHVEFDVNLGVAMLG